MKDNTFDTLEEYYAYKVKKGDTPPKGYKTEKDKKAPRNPRVKNVQKSNPTEK